MFLHIKPVSVSGTRPRNEIFIFRHCSDVIKKKKKGKKKAGWQICPTAGSPEGTDAGGLNIWNVLIKLISLTVTHLPESGPISLPPSDLSRSLNKGLCGSGAARPCSRAAEGRAACFNPSHGHPLVGKDIGDFQRTGKEVRM